MTRRPLLKCVTVWTAAVVLLLATYMAGAPIVFVMAAMHCQPALPFLDAVYTPLRLYAEHPEIPGSQAYNEYGMWCVNQFQDDMIYDSMPVLP